MAKFRFQISISLDGLEQVRAIEAPGVTHIKYRLSA